MTQLFKITYTIGAMLTGLGSILPWERGGDFTPYEIRGFFLVSFPPYYQDYGGALIIILSIAMNLVGFWPYESRKFPLWWNVILGFILFFDVGYHLVKLYLNIVELRGGAGAPTIEIGLVMVTIGSIILLVTALFHFKLDRRL